MREPDYSILAKLTQPTSKKTKRVSIAGQVFGRLTVYGLMGYAKTRAAMSYWLCRCSCGNWSIVAKAKLKNGSTKSCGCQKYEELRALSTTHGMSRTPTYCRWTDMLTRVNNPNIKSAKDYSERGITACDGLRQFENFYALLGEVPKKQEIDRIDNDGNYSCGSCQECLSKSWPMNVHWVPKKNQMRNKRTTRWITINGETKSMAEWVEISGVRQSTAWKRLAKGLAPEKAFELE